MRQLELDDVFRFSALVDQTGLSGVLSDILSRASSVRCHRKPVIDAKTLGETLAAMAGAGADCADIGSRAIDMCADRTVNDTELYALGIDSFISLVKVAAKRGVSSSLYAFLAPIWEMDADTIAHMKLKDVRSAFREMLEVNDVGSFFELLRSLTA